MTACTNYNVMYSFVAANLVRQSQRLQNRCELTQYIVSQHIILYNKNCIRAFLGHLMQSLYLTIFSNRQRWHTADLNFTFSILHFSTQNKNYLFLFRMYSSIAAAAVLPAPIARITVAAPVTASPPAYTPSRDVRPFSSAMIPPHF